jgi:hypothetical protein
MGQSKLSVRRVNDPNNELPPACALKPNLLCCAVLSAAESAVLWQGVLVLPQAAWRYHRRCCCSLFGCSGHHTHDLFMHLAHDGRQVV